MKAAGAAGTLWSAGACSRQASAAVNAAGAAGKLLSAGVRAEAAGQASGTERFHRVARHRRYGVVLVSTFASGERRNAHAGRRVVVERVSCIELRWLPGQ